MRVRFKPDFFCRLIKDENQAPFGGRFQSTQPLRHCGDTNRLYGSVYRGNTAYDPSLPIASAWPSACRGRFVRAEPRFPPNRVAGWGGAVYLCAHNQRCLCGAVTKTQSIFMPQFPRVHWLYPLFSWRSSASAGTGCTQTGGVQPFDQHE
jgi:hypothetical protein